MNQTKVTVFNNEEFGEVRTVTIDGEPWFCMIDVCKILEIKNASDCKNRLRKDGVVTTEVIDSIGRKQNANFVNESNLYKLIFQSRKESAERFTEWVTSEILPCIRKNGIYATDNVIDNILNNPDFGIELLTKLKEERAARVEAAEVMIHQPSAGTQGKVTDMEIDVEHFLKIKQRMNKILSEKKIQYKVNGTWVMYSDYSNCGYEEIKQEVLDNGHVIYHRKITQLGRKFILGLFDMAA